MRSDVGAGTCLWPFAPGKPRSFFPLRKGARMVYWERRQERKFRRDKDMTKTMRLWLKIAGVCLGTGAVATSVVILVQMHYLSRLWHDPAYAEHLRIDLMLIDGPQARVLEEFFEDRLPPEGSPDFPYEQNDIYLLSRVTSKPGREMYKVAGELIIEIVEPEQMKGERYTIVPLGGSFAKGVCYNLAKVRGGARIASRRPAPGQPVRYNVVHLYAE